MEEVLPARTIQHVECVMKPSQGNETAESMVWLIQGITTLEPQVHVIEGCSAENGELHLLLINSGEKEFILSPNSTIATAIHLEERSEIQLQTRDDQLEVNICDVLITMT